MNLFLVDDEPLTAKWIEEILKNRKPELHICGKAGSGKDALSILENCHADILITDIKMPGMNGLELIKEVKSRFPGMYIIILSSHSDFRFTSEAIRLGADDYLLKSEISDDDLHLALDRFTRLQQKETRTDKGQRNEKRAITKEGNDSRRKAVLSLLDSPNSPISRTEQKRDLHLLKIDQGPVFCLLIQYSILRENIKTENIASVISEYLDLLCEQGAVTILDAGKLCITGKISLLQSEHYEKQIISGIKSISDRIRNEFDLPIHFGLSSIRSSGDDFPQQYAESERVLNLQSFYIVDDYPVFNITRQNELQENSRILNIKLQEMNREISLEKWKTALQKGEEILDDLGSENFLLPEDAKSLARQILSLMSVKSLPEDLVIALDGADNYERLKKLCLVEFAKMQNLVSRKSHLSSSVEKACDYIIRHYNDSQISLINVSDYVSLNSTYLSDLFRKEMGVTFQDYIANIRLEKTEYLLEHTTLSISEIAKDVGFQSNSYFARFFRKYHQMSPREYREQKIRR